ncbi:MAG: helix-turn-helix domain-containing protein [Bacteroidetes bacterium]|nr:helix-turn-helix domain-containing protein [Bacteroidota bacterium]MBS1639500.1 helix-turn-helix domain-containing protein [Bacteroidota bacterium]MBS1641729.1 helix-turn-helix domain-containing protein [Bacteroidota bacterium]MBS1671195.1 helix-turn-helix domain-containing protein [Bacteroidota bacterium]
MFVANMSKGELAAFIKDSIKNSVLELKNEFSFLPKPTDEDFCTIDRVIARFKITKQTVHNWAKQGRVRKYKLNGRVLYKLNEIENNFNK